MRKPFIALLAALLPMLAAAQPFTQPAPQQFTLHFSSQHGETFSVFVDGDLQNRLPQSNVVVNNVSDMTHEVVVVMKRPADKCAVLALRPTDRTVIVNVNYDQRLEQLYLYTAAQNRADFERPAPAMPGAGLLASRADIGRRTAEPRHHDNEAEPASDEEVDAMVVRMRAQSYESDRLALGKVLTTASLLTARQTARLVATLDFSNSQVELLKHAYHTCLDPENYQTAIDVLTFSADKRKVSDYIATQH
ncbi:MAG: DUF4476 domain-containing protein [Bacteroidales bacterium]|nr:DUF4476 domain-containing protein [Bacteroidales bacterium]